MTSPSPPADPQLLRRLAHDLRSELFVVSMGLEQLKLVRLDEPQFREVFQMVSTEAMERLKSLINELAAEAQRTGAAPAVTSETHCSGDNSR